MRHEWESLGVGTSEEEKKQELHMLMVHSSAGHKVPSQPEQEHQGTVYTQANTKLKPLSDDGEHKKKRIGALKRPDKDVTFPIIYTYFYYYCYFHLDILHICLLYTCLRQSRLFLG